MQPIDFLVISTKSHLSNIGRETDGIDKNFIITGPNSFIESIIAVTLVVDLEEKILDQFDIKLDIFEIITELDNENITLDIISEKLKNKL